MPAAVSTGQRWNLEPETHPAFYLVSKDSIAGVTLAAHWEEAGAEVEVPALIRDVGLKPAPNAFSHIPNLHE